MFRNPIPYFYINNAICKECATISQVLNHHINANANDPPTVKTPNFPPYLLRITFGIKANYIL